MPIDSLGRFLAAIRNAYKDAREPLCSSECAAQIERGRNRTISAIAEDYFAELLCKSLNNDALHFFVDQPLSGAVQQIFPDVIVARKRQGENDQYEILYLLDLKMDIGYFREEYRENAEKLKDKLDVIRETAKNGKLSGKHGNKKLSKVDKSAPRAYFTVSPYASYDMVIITTENASRKKEEELNALSSNPNTNIWALSKDVHLNEYTEDCNYIPLEDDWNMLLDKIRKAY